MAIFTIVMSFCDEFGFHLLYYYFKKVNLSEMSQNRQIITLEKKWGNAFLELIMKRSMRINEESFLGMVFIFFTFAWASWLKCPWHQQKTSIIDFLANKPQQPHPNSITSLTDPLGYHIQALLSLHPCSWVDPFFEFHPIFLGAKGALVEVQSTMKCKPTMPWQSFGQDEQKRPF